MAEQLLIADRNVKEELLKAYSGELEGSKYYYESIKLEFIGFFESNILIHRILRYPSTDLHFILNDVLPVFIAGLVPLAIALEKEYKNDLNRYDELNNRSRTKMLSRIDNNIVGLNPEEKENCRMITDALLDFEIMVIRYRSMNPSSLLYAIDKFNEDNDFEENLFEALPIIQLITICLERMLGERYHSNHQDENIKELIKLGISKIDTLQKMKNMFVKNLTSDKRNQDISKLYNITEAIQHKIIDPIEVENYKKNLFQLLESPDNKIKSKVWGEIPNLIQSKVIDPIEVENYKKNLFQLLESRDEDIILDVWGEVSDLVNKGILTIKEVEGHKENLLNLLQSSDENVREYAWDQIPSILEEISGKLHGLIKVQCNEEIRRKDDGQIRHSIRKAKLLNTIRKIPGVIEAWFTNDGNLDLYVEIELFTYKHIQKTIDNIKGIEKTEVYINPSLDLKSTNSTKT
jgi:hypothetical protein